MARFVNLTTVSGNKRPTTSRALELLPPADAGNSVKARLVTTIRRSSKSRTSPSRHLSVGVSKSSCPIPNFNLRLNARNVKRVDFALYRIDLPRDVRFTESSEEDEGETDEGGAIGSRRFHRGPRGWSKPGRRNS